MAKIAPLKTGYAGQRYKLTAYDVELEFRIVIKWANKPFTRQQLAAIETSPRWIDAKSELVQDRTCGDINTPDD